MTETAAPTPDPKKAEIFFKKALECEKGRNWDYAIASYIMGLQYDPDNLDQHQKLIQAGKTRKSQGGKPSGGLFGEKFTANGKGPLVPMLQAEESVARDPTNIAKWEKLVRASTTAGAPKSAVWFGDVLLTLLKADPSTSGKLNRYKMLRDHYKALEAYRLARVANEAALALAPNDLDITTEAKNLAAMDVTKEGGYESASADGTSFKTSMKNAESQMDLLLKNSDVKTEEFLKKMIAQNKAKWEKEPTSSGLLRGYIDALLALENDENEKEAIRLLNEAYTKSAEFQLKVRAGDIQMRQYRRKLRQIKERAADPSLPPEKKAELLAHHDTKFRQVLEFEVAEYKKRIEKYPTDMELRYEVGRRQMELGLVDDSIDNLQQAEESPKIRIRVLLSSTLGS